MKAKRFLKSTVILMVLLCRVECLHSQPSYNYIIEKVYNGESYNPKITYYDGLGRPVQVINVAASPEMSDIIQHIEYDDFGRESRKYLPYVSDATSRVLYTAAQNEQLAFYTGVDSIVARDANPWSETVFEASPLNRVLKQGAPGVLWQPDNPGNEDYAVHFSYGTNDADEVIMFNVNMNNQLVSTYFYDACTLYKNSSRDENGVWSAEYKDFQGRVVLKVSDVDTLKAKTYYVYDDLGLLRYVIPPKAVDSLALNDTLDIADSLVDSLCYYYEYDARKRMSVKKLPGVDPVYMVWDKRDRLVLSQDGNMRDTTRWLFTKYDRLNRPVMTGIHQHPATISQDSMQSLVNTLMTYYYEDLIGDFEDDNFGYTNQSYPVLGVGDEILTVTYYDNYDYDADNFIENYSSSVNFINHDPDSLVDYAVKGMVTGSLVKVLGEEKYLKTATYYDKKYRVIRNFKENIMGGKEVTLNKYDFIGNILKSKHVIYKDSLAPLIINHWTNFDHVYRPRDIYHEIVDRYDTVHIAKMSYNEIGQLKTKQLHETSTGDYLQDIDYTYNIRGWLTNINNPENQGNDLFALNLYYNDITDIGVLDTFP